MKSKIKKNHILKGYVFPYSQIDSFEKLNKLFSLFIFQKKER